MADVFDPDAPPDAFGRLWPLFADTPHLDWLVLTKRPERMAAWAEQHALPRNVWAGTTVEDQPRCDERLRHLARVNAAVRFLSVEPQLEFVNPRFSVRRRDLEPMPLGAPYEGPHSGPRVEGIGSPALRMAGIAWVICGGESGPGARPFDPAWARWWRDRCREAGAAFFMKQMGTVWARERGGRSWEKADALGDLPEDLRVREFPEVRHG